MNDVLLTVRDLRCVDDLERRLARGRCALGAG
jgi:hypothetical protein